MSHYCNHFGNILDNIEELQEILTRLNSIYKSNQSECQHIHNKCIELIDEQKSMENEANRLRKIVLYFNDFNSIRAKLMNANNVDVTSNDFSKVVTRIDQCIEFLKDNVKLPLPIFVCIFVLSKYFAIVICFVCLYSKYKGTIQGIRQIFAAIQTITIKMHFINSKLCCFTIKQSETRNKFTK